MSAVAALETNDRKGKPWRWGPYIREETRITVPALLWTLHDMGGSISDSSGRSGAKLADMAKQRGMPFHPIHQPNRLTGKHTGTLSQLLAELDAGRMAGSIAREINGKRTLKITLLLAPEEMPPRPHPVVTKQVTPTAVPKQVTPTAVPFGRAANRPVVAAPDVTQQSVFVQSAPPIEPEPQPVPEPAPAPEPEPEDVAAVVGPVPTWQPTVLAPLPVVHPDDPMEQLLVAQEAITAAQIAMAAMVHPVPETRDEDDQIAVRLATALEEGSRLRRKVADLQETVTAKAKEAEALRKALVQAQSNMRAIREASTQSQGLERKLNQLNGTQRAIASKPEPAIAARR